MRNSHLFKPMFTQIPSSDNGLRSFDNRPIDAPKAIQTRESRSGVYLRRRVFVGLALIIVGALFWTVFSLVVGVGEKEVGADLTNTAPREIYIVEPGDTLWSIANGIDDDGDPRDTVDRLASLNGGSSIYVGQRLILSS